MGTEGSFLPLPAVELLLSPIGVGVGEVVAVTDDEVTCVNWKQQA